MTTEHIEIKILGRDYKLACQADDAPVLRRAATYVDNLVTRIKDVGKIKDADRIAVMAAIRIASELLSTREKDGPFAGLSKVEIKQQILELNRSLDDVLTPQEKLF